MADDPTLIEVEEHRALPSTTEDCLEVLLETYHAYYAVDDEIPLLAVLSAYVANHLPGNPVWLMVLGPPSSGKTEILHLLDGLPNVHEVSQISSEAAFLSGHKSKDLMSGGQGGILMEIGLNRLGILVLKDFTSILSTRRDQLPAITAALREIYDGSWVRRLGNESGQTLSWRGKCGLIGASTDIITTRLEDVGAMGERFVFVRMPDRMTENLGDLVERQAKHRTSLSKIRKSFAMLMRAMLDSIDFTVSPEVTREDAIRVMHLSRVVGLLRAAVERTSYRHEIVNIPPPEGPTRLAAILVLLYQGALAIGCSVERAWEVVTRIALDTVPRIRHDIFKTVAASPEPLTTPQIKRQIRFSDTMVSRALEELYVHRVLERELKEQGEAEDGRGRPSYLYYPSTEIKSYYEQAGLSEVFGAH